MMDGLDIPQYVNNTVLFKINRLIQQYLSAKTMKKSYYTPKQNTIQSNAFKNQQRFASLIAQHHHNHAQPQSCHSIACPNCHHRFRANLPSKTNYFATPKQSARQQIIQQEYQRLSKSPTVDLHFSRESYISSISKEGSFVDLVDLSGLQKLKKLNQISLYQKGQTPKIDKFIIQLQQKNNTAKEPILVIDSPKKQKSLDTSKQKILKNSRQKHEKSIEKSGMLQGQKKKELQRQVYLRWQSPLLLQRLIQWVISVKEECRMPYYLQILIEQYSKRIQVM